MRALSRLAVLAITIAGVTSAPAADFVGQPFFAQRAMPFTIYDYEPGVYTRAYWSPPWQYRHFFPVTGKAPIVGRDEDLSDNRELPPPAESFYREWSTSRLINEAMQPAAAVPTEQRLIEPALPPPAQPAPRFDNSVPNFRGR